MASAAPPAPAAMSLTSTLLSPRPRVPLSPSAADTSAGWGHCKQNAASLPHDQPPHDCVEANIIGCRSLRVPSPAGMSDGLGTTDLPSPRTRYNLTSRSFSPEPGQRVRPLSTSLLDGVGSDRTNGVSGDQGDKEWPYRSLKEVGARASRHFGCVATPLHPVVAPLAPFRPHGRAGRMFLLTWW